MSPLGPWKELEGLDRTDVAGSGSQDAEARIVSGVQAIIAKTLPRDQPSRARVVDVPLILGGVGAALIGGEHVFLRLGLNGRARIINWSMGGTVAGTPHIGTCTVDLLNGGTMGTLASICGGSPPSLASELELFERPPDGWSTDLADPSWLFARVTVVDGVLEEVGVTLRVLVSPVPVTFFVGDGDGSLVVDDNGDPVTSE
jgi:hypothetical protein